MKSKIETITWIFLFVILFLILVLIHYPIDIEENNYEDISVNWDDDKDIYEIFIESEKRRVYVMPEKAIIRYSVEDGEQPETEIVLIEKTKYTILTENKEYYLCILLNRKE